MKIGVLGGGESGVGAALLAKKGGENVWVSDYGVIEDKFKKELNEHNIRFEEGGHTFEILESQDLIIKSPGIPNTAKVIQDLKLKGIEVIGEVEYAYRHCGGQIIGITGTNGKTTVTNLTHHIMDRSGMGVTKGGNLGKSFSRLVIEGYDWYVVELSSFQLEDIVEFKPTVAALLNITPDHLDRYEYDIRNYLSAKARIAMNQDENDVLFIPRDERIFDKVHGNSMRLEVLEADTELDIDNPYLKGDHNLSNATFASEIAKAAGVKAEAIDEGLRSFVNDDHRLQPVARINEVLYVNDSKATNVDAVYYALTAYAEPIIWIAGGVDKGNDYGLISEVVKERVVHIIAMGSDNSKILEYFEGKVKSIIDTNSVKDAVQKASELGESGDVVLLSPACASFDLFDNYMHRGERYVEEVWSLMDKKKAKNE